MLAGRDIDEAIVSGLAAGDPKLRVELIRAAGDRPIRSAAAPLLAAAGDSNPEVRREALRALRDVAGPEQVPALISLLRNAGQSAERRDAQRALLSALRQSKSSHDSELMSACRSATDAETRRAFLEVMAQTGADETLPLFRELLARSDDDSRRAAINALSQWTSAAPAPDLLQAARSALNPAHRVLALRAYINVVALPSGRPPAETAKMLAGALALAAQPEEKRAILAALPRAPSPEALSLAESLLNDSAVAAEAKTAVNALKRVLSQKPAP
jgi:HEAT repeat protein